MTAQDSDAAREQATSRLATIAQSADAILREILPRRKRAVTRRIPLGEGQGYVIAEPGKVTAEYVDPQGRRYAIEIRRAAR